MVGLNNFMGRVSVLIANAFVTDELDKITSKSRVLLNFAGPYSWFGSQVVESCVRNMCHYVDLSLELPWVVKMIAKHNPRAVKECASFPTILFFILRICSTVWKFGYEKR